MRSFEFESWLELNLNNIEKNMYMGVLREKNMNQEENFHKFFNFYFSSALHYTDFSFMYKFLWQLKPFAETLHKRSKHLSLTHKLLVLRWSCEITSQAETWASYQMRSPQSPLCSASGAAAAHSSPGMPMAPALSSSPPNMPMSTLSPEISWT